MRNLAEYPITEREIATALARKVKIPFVDLDEQPPPAAAAPAVVYTAANCRLLQHEMDDRLAPFCELSAAELRRFIVSYLLSRKVCVRWLLLLPPSLA